MLARRVPAYAVVFLVSALWLLTSARPAAAGPADKEAIEDAVRWGVEYLQKEQKPTGYWGTGTGAGSDKGWGVGYTALAGLTCVECGVPTTNAGLKRAANVVRANLNDIDSTYELALAILFLDRMKEKTDKRNIQLLAGRLIAAQMPSGGWGYKAVKYSETDVRDLLTVLRKMSAPPTPPAAPVDPEKLRSKLPDEMRRLPVLFDPNAQLPADAKDKRNDLYNATTDNSNTHFAMIGLWTARRYDVPTDRTFARMNRRFRTSQGPHGTWGYDFVRGGADGGGATTCIALLGVAIGHVVAPEPDVRPEADPVILNAFAELSKSIGEPAGTTDNRPTVKDVGGLYFLWTMERIAVLYDLRKLGKKDWYLWGAEILLCHQRNGAWPDDGGYAGQSPIVNTCFALLFLRRANLMTDLSQRLVVDPGVLTAQVESKLIAEAPYPHTPPPRDVALPVAVLTPQPTAAPKPQPALPTAPTAPPSAPEPVATPAPPKKTPWLWIVLGVTLAGFLGGGLALFVVKRGKKDEEDEGKKKKKKRKKVKVRAETEGDEG